MKKVIQMNQESRVKKLTMLCGLIVTLPDDVELTIEEGTDLKMIAEITDLMEPEYLNPDEKYFLVHVIPSSVPIAICLEPGQYILSRHEEPEETKPIQQ